MVPTRSATRGLKGHRPEVGTWDGKHLRSVFAAVNVITGAILAHPLESPQDATKKTGRSQTRRRQEAFANHLRHVARHDPHERYARVVLLIDNAPWHAGQPIDEAWRENPHREFKRLPAYSPRRNPVERFWKALRRRATHHRRFDTLADLKRSIRNSLRYFQTMRERVKSLIHKKPKPKKIGQNL
jgi:transposase